MDTDRLTGRTAMLAGGLVNGIVDTPIGQVLRRCGVVGYDTTG